MKAPLAEESEIAEREVNQQAKRQQIGMDGHNAWDGHLQSYIGPSNDATEIPQTVSDPHTEFIKSIEHLLKPAESYPIRSESCIETADQP